MLTEKLYEYRLDIDDIDIEKLRGQDYSNIGGKLAELLVREWLERVPHVEFDLDIPLSLEDRYLEQGELRLVQGNRDVEVWTREGFKAKPIVTYDEVFTHNGKPYVAEVKSTKLNGYAGKIGEAVRHAEHFFGDETELLIFMPMPRSEGSLKSLSSIRERHPKCRFIDLGYRKRQFRQKVEEIYLSLRKSQLPLMALNILFFLFFTFFKKLPQESFLITQQKTI